MAIARANLIGGPCKIVMGGATLFSKSDVPWDFDLSGVNVDASMHGNKIDESIVDSLVKVRVENWGAWENLSIILPTIYRTPVIGSRIMGDSDTPCVITGQEAANNILTMLASAVTKPPDLFLGVDKTIFGPMEITGVVANNMDMVTDLSLYTLGTGAYADTTFAKTNFKQQMYLGAWGTRTGFTSIQAVDGWTISHELELEPVKVQTRTVDYRIIGYRAMAKCRPLGPSTAQLAAMMRAQNSAQGHLLGADVDDLVITGASTSPVVTLKNAAMRSGGFVFGNKPLRYGEYGWVTTVAFTAGVAQARVIFA
jgi:hypothetical protein